jgi:dihydrofolate synthase/folylpolyglutamate synthase
MTPREVTQYLDSFVNWETRSPLDSPAPFKLERIRRLLDLIGNPQDALKIIHVAGSKGKGSTCVFTAHILQRAGYKTGLYTSPHLKDCRERIRILNLDGVGEDREEIFPDAIRWDQLGKAIEDVRPAIDRMRADASPGRLTFFEVYTALALHYFFQERVDFAVLETGLGGRLDATNAAPSLVCAITPLSLEHTEILGGSLGQIAVEKAAIIKDRRQKVVLAPQEKESWDVLQGRCKEFCIDPFLVGRDIRYALKGGDEHGPIVHFQGRRGDYPDLRVSLLGEHQIVNAATAIGIVECLQETGVSIGREVISQGLRDAFWPGRFEIFSRDRCVILDGAHNKASAACLGEGVKKFFPGRRVVLILGVCDDKDRRGIGDALKRIVDTVIATKANHPRAHDFGDSELKEMFPGKERLRAKDIQQAWALAQEKTEKEDIVLITGSIFLVAEARDLIGGGGKHVSV